MNLISQNMNESNLQNHNLRQKMKPKTTTDIDKLTRLEDMLFVNATTVIRILTALILITNK